MEKFEYADEEISEREIMIAVASMIISVGVLSLPKDLATVTKFADGWVSIVLGGVITILFTWLATKLALSFQHQSFMSYATLITTKSTAVALTFTFSIVWISAAAYQVRKIADISKEYLFQHTPIEIIALAFFLVVVYAVSGPTVGLLRLNMLFFPIILFILFVIMIFNMNLFSAKNLLPVFKSSMKGYAQGIRASALSYSGFGVVLFYVALVKKPKKTATKAVIGIALPMLLYVLLFIAVIGVFGHVVTKNLLYPTVELAKTVEIPGGFFERFESIFFVIWIMAIFNTTAMTLDLAVISMNLVFKKMSKINLVLIIAPTVYLIGMIPKEIMEVNKFGFYSSVVNYLYTVTVIILLIIIAKLRRVKPSE